MAQLNQHFDASAVEPAAPFELLPPGRYSVQIVQSEMRATRAGNGQYLWLEMDVIEGPHQGRKIWDQLNLVNPNQQTVEIAQRTLSAICHAVAVMTLRDSHELHDIPMTITVALRKREDNGEMVNVVKGFSKREPTASAPRTPTAAGGAPWKR